MAEDMTLTASFIIDPVTPVQGKYAGLITSDDATEHGLLSGNVTGKGAFSLKARIGKLTIPLKCKFSALVEFTESRQINGIARQVTLTLNISGDGEEVITGSSSSGMISTEPLADRASFKMSASVP